MDTDHKKDEPPSPSGTDSSGSQEETTNTTTTTTTTTTKNQKEFQVGDHVFCWCSYLGVPFAYQQHGIVIETNLEDGSMVIMNFDYEEEEEEENTTGTTTAQDNTESPLQTKQVFQFWKKTDATTHQDDHEEGESAKSEGQETNQHTLAQSITKFFPKRNSDQNETEITSQQKEEEFPNNSDDKSNNLLEPKNQFQTSLASFFQKSNNTYNETETSQEREECPNNDVDKPELPQKDNQFQKSIANFFQKSSNKANKTETESSQEREECPNDDDKTELPQEENKLQKNLANFFQKFKKETNQVESNKKCETNTQEVPNESSDPSQQQLQRSSSSLSTLFASVPERPCTMTRQVISRQEAQDKWEHVQYGQQWHKRLISRAGTCSPLPPHPIPVVLMRIHFLQEHQQELLGSVSYHHQKANGESVACWCKAGQYLSLQGTAKMGKPGLHVASFGMAAEYAGIWGGQIAAAILFPPAIPFLAAYDIYDMAQYGHTFHQVNHVNKEWEERTNQWNERFSKYVLENTSAVERVQESLLEREGEAAAPPKDETEEGEEKVKEENTPSEDAVPVAQSSVTSTR